MLRVGILGCGPVTQAIHLPYLRMVSAEFSVSSLMDVNATLAERVAQYVGASWTTAMETVLNASDIDVVLVASPPQYHAEQVIAAANAGVRAILCEKPLATTAEQLEAIEQALFRTGTPIVVGAMHGYDPAWQEVLRRFEEEGDPPHTIRSAINLPPNTSFEDAATEVVGRRAATTPAFSTPAQMSMALAGAILGLAIHDIPIVSRLLGPVSSIEAVRAKFFPPYGYELVALADGVRLEFHAAMSTFLAPDWRVSLISDDTLVEVAFPPSYVSAGSAVATMDRSMESRRWGPYAVNGYAREWEAVAKAAQRGWDEGAFVQATADLRLALRLADAASARMMSESRCLP